MKQDTFRTPCNSGDPPPGRSQLLAPGFPNTARRKIFSYVSALFPTFSQPFPNTKSTVFAGPRFFLSFPNTTLQQNIRSDPAFFLSFPNTPGNFGTHGIFWGYGNPIKSLKILHSEPFPIDFYINFYINSLYFKKTVLTICGLDVLVLIHF